MNIDFGFFKKIFSRKKEENLEGFSVSEMPVEDKNRSDIDNQTTQIFISQAARSPSFLDSMREKVSSSVDNMKERFSSGDRVMIMSQTIVVMFILYVLLTRCWIAVFVDGIIGMGLSNHCVDTARSTRASAQNPTVLDKLSLTEGPLRVKGKIHIDGQGNVFANQLTGSSTVNIGDGLFYLNPKQSLMTVGSATESARVTINGRMILPQLRGEGTRILVVDEQGNMSARNLQINGNNATVEVQPQQLVLNGNILTITRGNSITLPNSVSTQSASTIPAPVAPVSSRVTDIIVTGTTRKTITIKQLGLPDVITTFDDLMSVGSGSQGTPPSTNMTLTGTNGITVSGSNLSLGGKLTNNVIFDLDGNNMSMIRGRVGINTQQPKHELSVNGRISIIEGGSGPQYYTTLQGADQSEDIMYTLPASIPTAGGFLRSTRQGVLSWSTDLYKADGNGILMNNNTFSLNMDNKNAWNAEQTFKNTTFFPGSSVFTSSGNLGIGLSNPTERLSVNGGIKIGAALTSDEGTIRWTGSDFQGRKGGSWVSLTSGDGSAGWVMSGNDIFTTVSGNVGIGTNNPVQKLHVQGGVRISRDATNYSQLYINNQNDLVIDPTRNVHVQLGIGNEFVIWDKSGAGVERMRVTHDGSVGIGTSNPNALLAIQGGNIALNGGWLSGAGPNEGVFVSNDGNVGINTAVPNESLTIDGGISFKMGGMPTATSGYGKTYAKIDGKLYFMNGTGTEYLITGGVQGEGHDNRIAIWTGVYNLSHDSLLFYDRFTHSLGIGASSASYRLDVSGTGRFTGLTRLEGGVNIPAGAPISINGNLTNFPVNTTQFVVSGNLLNLNTAYTNGSAFDGRFVNVAGDTMTGNLLFADNLRIEVDTIRARDTDGLSLHNSSGNGIVISNTGNISMGVATPLEKLDISGAVRIGNTTNDNLGTIRWTGVHFEGRTAGGWERLNSGGVDGTGQVNKLAFWSAADTLASDTDLHYDPATKRLGVNTVAPVHNVDVGGTGRFRTGGTGGDVTIATPDGESGMILSDGTSRADIRFDGSTVKIVTSLSGVPADANGIIVDTNGRVGIGTTNPQQRLDVNGGQIMGDDGSSALPLYAFRSSPGTGLFSPTTNALGVSINGVHKGTWNSTGLRIGDSVVPASDALHVTGTTQLDGNVNMTGEVYISGNDTHINSGGNNFLGGITNFRGAGGGDPNRVTINGATGNAWFGGIVGIGTQSPQKNLDIRGDVFIPGADIPIDCDGTTTTGVGTCSPIPNGTALEPMSDDKLDFNNDATPDGQPLCTNSLTSPTIIAVDDDNDCSNGAGGVVLLGTPDGSETITVGQQWAFKDDDGDGLLDNGEALYIDAAPLGKYYSIGGTQFVVDSFNGSIGVGTAFPQNSIDAKGSMVVGTSYAGQVKAPTDSLLVQGSVGISTVEIDADYVLQLPNNDTKKALAFAWDTYSDSRIKTDQRDSIYGLKHVLELKPKAYTQHEGNFENGHLKLGRGKNTFGFIAQEVYDVIPDMVHKPDDEATAMWTINYDKFAPVIVKAIQEQYKEIISIKTKLEKAIKDISLTVSKIQARIDNMKIVDEEHASRLDDIEKSLRSIERTTEDYDLLNQSTDRQIGINHTKTKKTEQINDHLVDEKGSLVIKKGIIKGNDNIRGINVPVKTGDNELTITFNSPRQSDEYAVTVTPSWLTVIAVSKKTNQSFTVQFLQEAPEQAQLDWVIID